MNARERAAAIRDSGAQARKDLTPRGAPKRIYDYWLDYSDSLSARRIRSGSQENFCHFFWTVVVFAPALAIKRWADRHEVIITLLSIAFLVVSFLTLLFMFGGFREAVLFVLAVLVGTAAVIVAGFAGFSLGYEKHQRARDELIQSTRNALLLSLLFPPLALIAYVIAKAIQGWDRMLQDTKKKILIHALTLVAFIPLVLSMTWGTLGFSLTALAYAGLILFALFGYTPLVNYWAGKSREREIKAYAAREERLTNYPYEDVKERKPSPIKKFFSGILDFLILIGQMILVSKWQLCPFVNVVDEKRETL